jgi:hypothetical protein
MRTFLLALLPLALTGATLGAVAPAHARSTATQDVRLAARGGTVSSRACGYGPARYRVSVDESRIPDLRSWAADVTITGPGRYHDTASIYGPTDGEGWHAVFFCKTRNRPGRYTVRAHVDITHDDSYRGSHTYETLRTTFYVHTRR